MTKFEERAALVDKFRKEGRTLADALSEAHTSRATYYAHRAKVKKVQGITKRAKFIDLPMAAQPVGVITLIVCSPTQLSQVLKEIK